MLLMLALVTARVPDQPETARTPDSANMVAVARWRRGGAEAVALLDGFTYVGSGSSLLTFQDSVRLCAVELPGACEDLTVAGGCLYAATGRAGLVVLDISSPGRPRIRSHLALPGYALSVAATHEALAAVGSGPDGAFLLDVSAPELPLLVCSAAPAESVPAVALLDSLVLFACGKQGLVVARLDHGLSPVAWFGCPGPVLDLAHKDSVVYAVCGDSGVIVVNVACPEQPRRVRRLDLPSARAMAVFDTMAVVVSGEWGAWILSVADPAAPSVWCYLAVPGFAGDVALAGARLAIAGGSDGLYQYDVSRPTFPVLVHHVSLVGNTIDFAMAGDVAWVCATDGLHAAGLDSPVAEDLGFLELPARLNAVALGRDFGLVSVTDSGVLSFAADDPRGPGLLGFQKSPGMPGPIAVRDSWAFVSVRGYGIQVLNVAEPESMEDVGALRDVPAATGLSLRGAILALAAGEAGLYFCDVRRPYSPQVVQRLGLPGRTNAVWLDTITIAAGDSGLFVLDTRDVTDPRLIARVTLEDEARDVMVADTLCYVACGLAGVVCLDFRNPESPVMIGHYRTASEVCRLGPAGTDVVLADPRSGLTRVRFRSQIEPRVWRADAGPTVVCRVLWLGAMDGRGNLGYSADLLDTSGRKVLALRGGPNDVRRLAPGVYFVREYAASSRRPAGRDVSSVTRIIVTR
jgi:hypothetical protein